MVVNLFGGGQRGERDTEGGDHLPWFGRCGMGGGGYGKVEAYY